MRSDGREFSFGHSKLTVPNKAAVPVALTRERAGREYLNVSGEAARGGGGRVLAGCRIEGGIGFDVAAVGRRVAARDEIATPIRFHHRWEDGDVRACPTLRIFRCSRRMTATLTTSRLLKSGMNGMKETTTRTLVHKQSSKEGKKRNVMNESVRQPPHACKRVSRASGTDTLTY